jgi:hypothetical protein
MKLNHTTTKPQSFVNFALNFVSFLRSKLIRNRKLIPFLFFILRPRFQKLTLFLSIFFLSVFYLKSTKNWRKKRKFFHENKQWINENLHTWLYGYMKQDSKRREKICIVCCFSIHQKYTIIVIVTVFMANFSWKNWIFFSLKCWRVFSFVQIDESSLHLNLKDDIEKKGHRNDLKFHF